jgi:phosphoglycolate phosphatase/pyrophosphatase PpaX
MTARAIIFDLDGTLADTFELIFSSWNAAVGPVVGRAFSDQEVMARFGPTEIEMIRREIPPEYHEAAVARFRFRYAQDHAQLACVFGGVPEMLAALSSAGIPMGVMTGKSRDTADITLAKLGWTNLFASVVTGDEVTRAKPDPQGVLLVATELGIAPRDCIFVGDAPYDIEAGKAAGMKTLWAGWHPIYAQRIRELKPDHSAQNPADILKILGLSSA